jgi:monooxygenase
MMIEVQGPDGKTLTYTCNFLQMCSGYYDYDGGYMPGWPGMERFRGEIVHPQQWAENLDYAGKRVVRSTARLPQARRSDEVVMSCA